MHMKTDICIPTKDAADGIPLIQAIPESDNVFWIPNKWTLKCWYQKSTGCQKLYELQNIPVLDAYFAIMIIQRYFSAARRFIIQGFLLSRP
jgi:hypothetical protein